MGTVTVSINDKNQKKLDFIKLHIPDLTDYSGDMLVKQFVYKMLNVEAERFGYKEKKV